MLAAAEPYFREFAVEVWRTEVAHSKRYEFLIYCVRSSPLSGVSRNYLMPRWAEPQRHTVVIMCACVCLSVCVCVCMFFARISLQHTNC